MAITRAQQFKQMLAQGGRIGLFRGAEADARAGRGDISPGTDRGGNVRGGGGDNYTDRIMDVAQRQRRADLRNLSTRQAEDKAEEAVEVFRSRNRGGAFNKALDFLPGIGGIRKIASTFGPINTRDFLLDKVLDAGRFNYKGNILTKQQFANLTEEEKEDVLDSYLGQRGLNEIDAYGNPIGDGGGDGQQFMFPQRLQASAPSITKKEEEEKNKFNFRLLADGGRAGFQEGGIMPRLNQLGSGVSSAEQMLQGINERLQSAESSLGGSGATPAVVDDNRFKDPVTGGGQPFFGNMNPLSADLSKPLGGMFDGKQFDSVKSAYDYAVKSAADQRAGGFMGRMVLPGEMGFEGFSNLFNFQNDPNSPQPQLAGISGIPAAGYANGGNVVGGEFDFESARQMYGLGKLVKKVTRTVKKIAKSPIGKAAILGAGAYYGLNAFPGFAGLSPLKRAGVIAGGLLTLSPFFMKQKQEDIIPEEEGADIDDPQTIMANAFRYQNIRTMAEGGSTEKEPVAEKTMPLLDMGGMEKDYREDGGFVPIGRMEKADDVPARLSKNEFVFTADAVRNAGDGNVDKGAEVMYNMMKNLEAGGEVSEESQGLEGAKEMFQTSQRLGEVV